ncbi:MAG TPA: YkvA family protein [Noviherbaspirillum sp.]|jgi:uncharacterized membrane protein YkvA (DUF1232 family)|uniref:YkvA family protein n=1 Tax=Noviherbaspirillum sp. TaxID=1926288 RepID=UPI002F9500D3
MLDRLKQHARRLKADTLALYYAARHPATPWYAKLLVAAIVAYACSPIDLIPDFIPVLGLLDELVLLPAGIALAIRLVPGPVLQECRARAAEAGGKPVSLVAAIVIGAAWLLLAGLLLAWLFARFEAVR